LSSHSLNGFNRIVRRLCIIILALLWFWLGCDLKPLYADRFRDELKEKQERIEEEKKIIKDISSKKISILDVLENLDKQIDSADRRFRSSRKKINILLKEITELKKNLKSLEKRIQKHWRNNSERLVIYYRLGRAGMLPLMFSELSLPEKFQHFEALKKILLADWRLFQEFQGLLDEQKTLEADLPLRLAQEKGLQKEIRKEKQLLVTKRQQKDGLLLCLENDSKAHLRLLDELRRSVKSLEKKIKEEQMLSDLSSESTLINMKGRLPWPVEGSLHRKFGNKDAVKSQGIDIKTLPGKPVRAIYGGGVVYADWFRGYGKLLIIHHGAKDYSIISHMSQLTKTKGERVESGEIIGITGDTGSVEGCMVHFEIWHQGKPRDPLKWIYK